MNKPKFIDEEGTWPVKILRVEDREDRVRVFFKRGRSKREFVYVVRVWPTRTGWMYKFPPDAALEPVLKAGRGRLETKRIPARSGLAFMLHTWSTQ